MTTISPVLPSPAARSGVKLDAASLAGWVLLLLAPATVKGVGFALLVVAELSVPFLAERGTPTPWHPEHIAERYGLFTLIVLGVVGALRTWRGKSYDYPWQTRILS